VSTASRPVTDSAQTYTQDNDNEAYTPKCANNNNDKYLNGRQTQ